MLKIKSEIWVLIGIVAIGLGNATLGAFYFMNTEITSIKNQWYGLQNQVTEKTAELDKLQKFAADISQVKEELRQLNHQLEIAMEHMPRTFDLSGLLRKLTLLAQNSGLEVSTFTPEKETQESEHFYKAIRINFSLSGGFAQTLSFFDQLTRLKRIVEIVEVQMDANNLDANSLPSAMTRATIVAYRFAE